MVGKTNKIRFFLRYLVSCDVVKRDALRHPDRSDSHIPVLVRPLTKHKQLTLRRGREGRIRSRSATIKIIFFAELFTYLPVAMLCVLRVRFHNRANDKIVLVRTLENKKPLLVKFCREGKEHNASLCGTMPCPAT